MSERRITSVDPFGFSSFNHIQNPSFEDLFLPIKKLFNYPPCNIIKKDNDNFIIEFAVAGFKTHEIEVSFENGRLLIVGKNDNSTKEENFLYKGISNKEFRNAIDGLFNYKVETAEFDNGILRVFLEKLSEETKNKIEIKKKD